MLNLPFLYKNLLHMRKLLWGLNFLCPHFQNIGKKASVRQILTPEIKHNYPFKSRQDLFYLSLRAENCCALCANCFAESFLEQRRFPEKSEIIVLFASYVTFLFKAKDHGPGCLSGASLNFQQKL